MLTIVKPVEAPADVKDEDVVHRILTTTSTVALCGKDVSKDEFALPGQVVNCLECKFKEDSQYYKQGTKYQPSRGV